MIPTTALLALSLSLSLCPLDAKKVYKSKQATIRSNASATESKTLGKRIDFYCKLFEEFYSELGLKKRSNNRMKLRLFATHDEYEEFYKRGGASLGGTPLAYWSPSINSIVMYSDEKDVALRAVVFHETSHQFLSRYTADAPKWLNEGLAEYFEGWKLVEGESAERRAHLFDLSYVKNALKADKFLQPKELIEMSRQGFNDFGKNHPGLPSYLHYATSWSLVYYGMNTKHVEDHERLIQYINDLRDLGPNAEFSVTDWEAFTARWKAYLMELNPQPKDALDHFLVASGHRSNQDFKQAVKWFKLALELDPKLPRVRYWIGYCLKRQGKYKAAFEAFEGALKEDPEYAGTPYYLARMHLGIDNKSAKPNLELALQNAKLASKLLKDSSATYLELLTRCQIAMGDRKQALSSIKKIAKALDKDDLELWEPRIDRLKKTAKEL